MAQTLTRTAQLPVEVGGSRRPDDVRLDLVDLAVWVQRTFRHLARQSPTYASVLASRVGVRLAGHIAVGDVADVTDQGRDSLFRALDLLCRAVSIEPGLDRNQFMDRLLERGPCL